MELYDKYVQACLNLHLKPQSSNYVGKCVASVFPNVQAKRCRSKADWTKSERRYVGLSAKKMDENQISTSISSFPEYLQDDMFVME